VVTFQDIHRKMVITTNNMGNKTFIITLPKPLPPGAEVKGIITNPSVVSLQKSAQSITRTTYEVPSIEIKEPRKRQKLDHLTQEEKMLRRKLKNRVAAQTARDRKKARMDELEDEVSALQNQIKQLTYLTDSLAQKNAQLVKENDILREEQSACTCRSITKNSVVQNGLTGEASVCFEVDKSAVLSPPRAVTKQAVLQASLITFFLMSLFNVIQKPTSVRNDQALPIWSQCRTPTWTSVKWSHHRPWREMVS